MKEETEKRLGIAVLALTLLGILLAPLAAEAQQPGKVPRIAYLSSASADSVKSWLAAFRQGLEELGYWEGKNIVIEQRYAAGQFERLPELAMELIRLKVDVLVAGGAPAARAAKNATGTIPIVMAYVADPVGIGLVASLARPGGNITGLSDFNLFLVTKRLELIKEVVPTASRVAVLLNPDNPTNPLQLKELQAVAPALGVTLLPLEAKRPDDIDRAFATMRKERPGALLVFGDPMFGTHRKRMLELAVKNRLPAIYSSRPHVDAGGLMSYGTDFANLHLRAATYVDKILKGTKPANLPVEQPTKFELIINLKTAKALGLTIPQSILIRADHVIQ